MNGYYTDLAIESGRIAAGEDAPGIRVKREAHDGVSRVRVDVLDERGEQETGRRIGSYSTLYSDALDDGGPARNALRNMLIDELRAVLPPEDAPGGVLVLGLGNRQVTPDALGPRTADMVLGTRALLDSTAITGLRRVMTAAPGVYGATGIEAGEAVKGLVRELHPEMIIAVDALCARDITRIATTVQLSDSGIQPGSGVGNHRAELSRDSLGVQVIAIGVPMVVYAATIVRDACQRTGLDTTGPDYPQLDAQRLDEALDGLIVAPREIDSLIERSARLLSEAINLALHPSLTEDELRWLTI